MDGEQPLEGGRTTAGVVRIGDTVHRPSTSNSRFVRDLLRHLAAADFEGAPRALGIDAAGRDIFSFIEGYVPKDLSLYDDDALGEAARLIRRYHDFTADYVLRSDPRPVGADVVCHNDLSPCNFVFRRGLPVAIIDFDAAKPGSRSHDLGYAAWLWLDLGNEDVAAAEQRRRLLLFLAAYGVAASDRQGLVAGITARQEAAIARGSKTGNAAMASWAEACRDWTLRHAEALLAP